MYSLTMAAAAVLIGCATILPLPNELQVKNMQEAKTELKHLILTGRKQEATTLARSLGPQAGDVLLEASSNNKASVRMLALELAAANPSPGSCRTILGRLSDSNATVRSVAGNLIGQCQDHDNARDVVDALEQQNEPSIRRALVSQLGVIGGPEHVPVLRELRLEPAVSEVASLALVQLGDSAERRKLINRLQDPDPQVRTNALRDCMTVRDPKIAAWFGPALDDSRDVLPITGPHEGPMVYARVCDFAVLVMAQLGYRFSFPVEFLERRPPEQIREARKVVDAMVREKEHE